MSYSDDPDFEPCEDGSGGSEWLEDLDEAEESASEEEAADRAALARSLSSDTALLKPDHQNR